MLIAAGIAATPTNVELSNNPSIIYPVSYAIGHPTIFQSRNTCINDANQPVPCEFASFFGPGLVRNKRAPRPCCVACRQGCRCCYAWIWSQEMLIAEILCIVSCKVLHIYKLYNLQSSCHYSSHWSTLKYLETLKSNVPVRYFNICLSMTL